MTHFLLFKKESYILSLVYGHLFQIIPQIFTLIFTEDTQRKADQGPQVDHTVATAIMLTEFVNLRMAVVAAGNAIVGFGVLNLVIF